MKGFNLEKEKDNIIKIIDIISEKKGIRCKKKFIGNKLFIYNIRPIYIMYLMDLGKQIREDIISNTIFNECKILEEKTGRIIIGF